MARPQRDAPRLVRGRVFIDELERYGACSLGRELHPSLVDAHIHNLMASHGIDRILTVDAYFEHAGMTNLVALGRKS